MVDAVTNDAPPPATIAVTGATGFIGRALVRRIALEWPAARIRVLVRRDTAFPADVDDSRLDKVPGDLGNETAIGRLVDGSDAVVHIAGAIAGSSARDFDRTNVDGTQTLLEQVRRLAPAAHVVFLSSLAARHPELSWYARSKHAAEQLFARHEGPATILRPPAVYGPADPALADFWRWLARGWLIRLGPAEARFSLVHVEDVCEAILRLLPRGSSPPEPLALAGPQPAGGWTWTDVARLAAGVSDRRVRVVALPGLALKSAAAMGLAAKRLAGRPALLSPGKVRELRHPDWVCDNRALSEQIDWQPSTTLAQSLATLPGWSVHD